MNFGNDIFNQGKAEEESWLDTFQPWSEYHSKREPTPSRNNHPGRNALKPLIGEKVSTLKAQYHCMNIIKKDANFINRSQKPIDVSDQPVYALSLSLSGGTTSIS